MYNRYIYVATASFAVLSIFQNCSGSFNPPKIIEDTKVELSSHPPAEEVAAVTVPVTEHPIAEKTITTSFNLTLSDRNYLAATLEDVFGPASHATLIQKILLKSEDLGGPCSEYADYKVKSGTTFTRKDPAKACTEVNSTKKIIPPAHSVRQGIMIQTCSTLVGQDTNPATLIYALGKIKANSSLTNLPMVNKENLTKLHRLFYRERPLPPDTVFDALTLIFQDPKNPSVEDWKTAINSYCISSQWQVL